MHLGANPWFFKANNKIGSTNGSTEPPLVTEQPKEYALWRKWYSMILSWLAYYLEINLKGVVHAMTAHGVWENFKEQFSQKNAPTIYQIQKPIASLTQGTMTVSAYYTQPFGAN